ncbi:esterase-like activity of phytase family protein [Flavobacterium sp.]|uniref:DUF6929 family protein n=1 Tax=Flavobacterium sp. TaxID=239 RepID=UPI0024879D00|nr:esterase-like activity of phytase family protein [Flavobacterium sp.]MDI1317215.1 esterase-like activity of phytase family protein [Flavobacterium sp.]
MEKFQLSLLFKIIGIGSASGLVYLDDKLYIISDSSSYLYEYQLSDAKLNKIALVDNPQENIAKKDKPDLEAIALKGKNLYLFGSGSTESRNRLFKYKPKSGQVIAKDSTDLYSKIKREYTIADDELNIEGVILNGESLYIFQRGNGKIGKNGIIYAYDSAETAKFEFIPFDLPKIRNVATTFTDAILIGETIYFLATAEDTTSTYLDGEVLGSSIGSIDLKTMKLIDWIQITNKHKFEGLTLFKKSATEIEFLLCEDNDTEKLESNIYKLVTRQKG